MTRESSVDRIRLPPATETRSDHDGRGEMPAGSLHRPMVSASPGELTVRQRRTNDDAVSGSLTIRLIALVSQKTRKQARTRWMRHHPSRCEEPLREAGVRAAIPGRHGHRGPEAAKAAGWPAQDRQQAGGKGAARLSSRRLDATSFFPQPFEVRVDPQPRPRGLGLDRHHCEGFDPGSE